MTESVVILHSNDIHSRLENVAKIATYIEEQRQLYGNERLLLIDCGDHMDRMRLETEGSDGMVNVALLNSSGYEVIALGNNEGLTYSKETLEWVYKDTSFTVLGANMLETDSGALPEWMQPHTIVCKNGIKIGLIGVTARFTDFYELLGWDLTDPMLAIQEQVALLRDQVAVVAVISHVGITFDKALAEQVAGIDLIMGAHTHHLLEEPVVIGDTTICAAGKFGEHIGRVEIEIDPISTRPKFRASCVPTAAYAEQPEATAIIGGFREAGLRRLSRVITRLDAPLPANAERESPLGNLLAAGLRRHTDAEIGIVNTGQLLGGLAAGDVTEGQLHALCPSPINPCRIRIAGKELRTALEQALLSEYTSKPIKGYGFRGEVLGTLAIDGMSVEYDSNKPPLQQITAISVNGEPFSDEKNYIVGSIDMFTFHIGYMTLGQTTEANYFLPEFLRDILAEGLTNHGTIIDSLRQRWTDISLI